MVATRSVLERRAKRAPVVLHVVEAYGGGVAAAVDDYIASLPELRHVLLAYRRPGAQLAREPRAELIDMPSGRGAQLKAVRQAIATTRPDVIHAHSSYAGAYVRLASPRHGARIVYSPHCYAFERRDVPGVARAALWGVEAALAWRTDGVGVVGEWERILARRLSPTARPVLVPHRVQRPRTGALRRNGGPVVTVGRVEPQKDPAFFAAAARAALRLGSSREWRWIGGGDESLEHLLRDSGVVVTGWKRRDAVAVELAAAHAYVHTAAWEGNPVAVLEAAAVGLPVVARDIRSLRHAGLPQLVTEPDELARRVIELDNEHCWRRLARETARQANPVGPIAQADALRRLYGLA